MKNTILAAAILAASLAPSEAWAARTAPPPFNGKIAICTPLLEATAFVPAFTTGPGRVLYGGLLVFFGCI